MDIALALTDLWRKTSERMLDDLGQEAFDAWIEPLRVEDLDGDRIAIIAPNEFHYNWLMRSYRGLIEKSVALAAGAPVHVYYQISETEEADAEQESSSRPDQIAAALNVGASPASGTTADWTPIEPFPLNPSYSFDNFVVGEANRFAHAAAQAVAEPESRAYNPLFLYGGVGLGKTHLMHAIGLQMLEYGRHFNVLYTSSEAFMNSFIEAVRTKKMTDFRNCFRKVDLLLIDDVQFFAGAERSQIEFFHTFNALFDQGKKIVISSDHPPKELNELEERLRSRFEMGLIVDIQPPDLETRVAILQRKAETMNLDLDPEVSIFIAEHIKTNIRKIEGALNKLAAGRRFNIGPLTIDVVRDLLVDFFSGEEPVKISVEKIQLEVCRFFEIHLHDMTGSNRSRKFTWPRQIAAYLSREMTDLSYPDIARKFGGRDHTSIMHAHRKVSERLEKDLATANLVKNLQKTVKEEPYMGRPA